jgi:hypothetical protein
MGDHALAHSTAGTFEADRISSARIPGVAICSQRLEPTESSPWLYRVADRFFVDQVLRAPDVLSELVPALFSGARGDSVLAFLDDRARTAEQLEVAFRTPGWLRWWLGGWGGSHSIHGVVSSSVSTTQ